MIYIYDSLLCTYLFTVINFFYRIEMINKKIADFMYSMYNSSI